MWMIIFYLFCANANQVSAQNSSTVTKDMQNPHMKNLEKEPIVSTEVRIVDDQGKTRLILSAKTGLPVVTMLGSDGTVRLSMSLNQSDYGSIKIKNPNPAGPVAALELDDKGAHVKLDRPGGASSYLFLNNAGESGTVFLDANGKRRLNLLVTADGQAHITRFDEQQDPLP